MLSNVSLSCVVWYFPYVSPGGVLGGVLYLYKWCTFMSDDTALKERIMCQDIISKARLMHRNGERYLSFLALRI